jgi:hypothetical protein
MLLAFPRLFFKSLAFGFSGVVFVAINSEAMGL